MMLLSPVQNTGNMYVCCCKTHQPNRLRVVAPLCHYPEGLIGYKQNIVTDYHNDSLFNIYNILIYMYTRVMFFHVSDRLCKHN